MINDAKNTMMTSAPVEKAGFHFPGDGIYHNVVIWAANLEEATKDYLATRVPISPDSATIEVTVAPAPANEKETDVQ